MPAKPTPWDLTKEEMDAIQARFQSLGDELVAFVAEMLVYKHDTDGQLGDQYSRLDELKAGAKSLSDLLATLRKDHESWRNQFIQNDKDHVQQLAQLSTKAGELTTLTSGLRSDLTTASTSVSVLGTANKRQDERLDRMDGRFQDLETVNRNQDSATDALRRQVEGLALAVQMASDGAAKLGASVMQMAKDLNAQTTKLQELETRLTALESVPKPIAPADPVAPGEPQEPEPATT